MLDAQRRVKLMDFGVAKITDPTAPTARRGHHGRHALVHVARAGPGPPIDNRSDLFSSGIVLYQFLTGQQPFTGGDWTLAR